MHIAIFRLIVKRTVKEYTVKEKWNNKKHLINEEARKEDKRNIK